MTTALIALLLSAFVLLLYELHNHRDGWLRELQDHADHVAQASLPVQDDEDLQSARQQLAELRRKSGADAAGLYDAQGRLIAETTGTGRQRLPEALPAGPAASQNQGIELRRPVIRDGQLLGMLVLRARYDVTVRLLNYAGLLGAVTLASLMLAALVAERLQRAITEPIVAVAAAARQVVQTRNFGLRVPRTTQDEVGALVDAFNDMLGELGSQAEALAASDRRKDEFLATLAHELRNPLAPIATALALLRRTDNDRDNLLRLTAMMQRQLQQLVRLIDDLMEVSRINTGRFALRPEKLDLVDVVRTAVEGVAPLLLERRHTLQVQWPPPIWLQGDRTRLDQVFGNLLGNAAKYTEPGGRIDIAFEVAAHTAAVQVADNGLGIAPERQAEVFEMFSRVEPSGLGNTPGLGVGLAVARQLVALHGGQLQLRSAGLGRGSVFTVMLPRLAEAPAAVAPPAARPAARPPRPPGPKTVLVADDNADYADSLADVLRGHGYDVRVAHDGQAALALAREALPEVGLFDVGMPGLDGYELARAVRGEPGGAACLLVAVTGWGQQADRQRAREAGFDEHLVKPVDVDGLLALLDERVGLHPPADPVQAGAADPARRLV
ncbi:MAG TPA: ATP-binding protein [Roseateles sp.]